MNVALARALYAHALVASPKLALGRVRPVSRMLGDPRWRGADLFLSLHNILPVRYPLDGITISEILAMENYAGRLIDCGVILPRLLGFVQDGRTACPPTRGPTMSITRGRPRPAGSYPRCPG